MEFEAFRFRMSDSRRCSHEDARPVDASSEGARGSIALRAPAGGTGAAGRLLLRLRQRSPTARYAIMLAAVAVIGVFDYITGPQLTVSFFYALPVYALAVTTGTTGGIIAALAGALAHYVVVLLEPLERAHPLVPYWNLLVEFALFVLVALSAATWQRLSDDLARVQVETRNDLLATVSHDLRGPLTALLLNARIIERSGGDPVMLERARQIHRIGRSMEQLISDYLDLMRLQDGRLTIEPRRCNVADLLRDALSTVEPVAADKQIVIDRHLASTRDVVCDYARIQQVLSNVLGNAVKYTPNGGHVSVDVETPRAEQVTISIHDSGPGIPADALAHVFDRYWQGAQGRAGVGLGLAIAKAIVDAHGERLWLDSELGRGTTFHFTLRAAD
jgi:signal transduction histidine kinase